MPRLSPIAVLALLLTAIPAGGQVPTARSAAQQVCPGQEVRVDVGPRRIEGWCSFVQDSVMSVRTGARDQVIKLDSVDAVWVRTSATGHGALWGGLVGGALGAATGGFFGYALCEGGEGCGGNITAGAFLGGAVVGAGGALIGALLGSMEQRWSREFP